MFAAGSPLTPFVDAVKAILVADATLMAVAIGGVHGHMPAARTPYPYVVLGQRSVAGDVALGGRPSLVIDVWSDAAGPFQAQRVLSRIVALLERRQGLRVTGFDYVDRSLHCEFEDVDDEPDADMPNRRLYHGQHRWVAELHEV